MRTKGDEKSKNLHAREKLTFLFISVQGHTYLRFIRHGRPKFFIRSDWNYGDCDPCNHYIFIV